MAEIRFFYKRQVFHPLSPHGQALWHYLMWRANEVFWQLPLRLSVPEIAGATHMSAAMVKKARTELEKSGYIRCVMGKRIMRTETAATVSASIIGAVQGWLE